MTALTVGIIAALYVHVAVLGSNAAVFLAANGATPSPILPLLRWRHPYVALDALRHVAQALFLHASCACLVISPKGQVPTMLSGIECPVVWLLVAILLSVAPLHPYPEAGTVALPYLLLAYAVGAGLGPLYHHQRPILLRA